MKFHVAPVSIVTSTGTSGSFRRYFYEWRETLQSPPTKSKLKTISCGRGKDKESVVFGITEDGTPYRFTRRKWFEVDSFDGLKNTIGSISADGGFIWAINTEGEVISKSVGFPGTTAPLGFNMVSILSYNGAVYGINNKAELVMFKSDTKK